MNLYLFNPDADLALADFSENYMPPALIRQMAADLAVLPMWWAGDAAAVLAASAYNQSFIERMSSLFPLSVRLLTPPELAETVSPVIHPWGWNPALCRYLLRKGVAPESLPSASYLSACRAWSGRGVALDILASFRDMPGCCGEGTSLHTLAQCASYWRAHQGRCVFKAPWSGSGKGLLWCYSSFSDSVSGWCQRQLTTQQHLIAMPIYNKVYDFAMEFSMDGCGEVSFVGYSFFDTNAKGAYQGNLLAPDAAIESFLSQWVPSASLAQIRVHLQAQLLLHFPHYCGCLGVDMMVCRLDDGSHAVFPCVEVNLRMNMGIVAHTLGDRFLQPGVRGRFSVEAYPSPQALQAAVGIRQKAHPAVISQGRLVCGYLPLVPVTPQSRYVAYLEACTDKKTAENKQNSI